MIIITVNSFARQEEMETIRKDILDQAKTGIIVLPPICKAQVFEEEEVTVIQEPASKVRPAAWQLQLLGYQPGDMKKAKSEARCLSYWVKETDKHKFEIEVESSYPGAYMPTYFRMDGRQCYPCGDELKAAAKLVSELEASKK